jgi:hypothetical protein
MNEKYFNTKYAGVTHGTTFTIDTGTAMNGQLYWDSNDKQWLIGRDGKPQAFEISYDPYPITAIMTQEQRRALKWEENNYWGY